MLVLDTDLLTIIQRREGQVYARLEARLEAVAEFESICVTIISLEEQMRGWLSLIAKARSRERQMDAYRRLHAFVDDFAERQILDYDYRASARYEQLAKSRIRIGTSDLKIAAIVLSQGATLLSRNLADFRKVPGLGVEDWAT